MKMSVVVVSGPAQIGQAIARRVVSSQTIGAGKGEAVRKSVEITVENDKPIQIQFELSSHVENGGRILAESMPHKQVQGGVQWTFPLVAGQKEVVSFTVERPANS